MAPITLSDDLEALRFDAEVFTREAYRAREDGYPVLGEEIARAAVNRWYVYQFRLQAPRRLPYFER